MKTLFALTLVLSCLYSKADQPQTGLYFGERPKNSIFDPKEIITTKQTAEIAEPLAKVLSDENLDVMVVILPSIRDTPPEHIAKKLGEKWALSRVYAVVLHVPGKERSPWIFPGYLRNEMLAPEKIEASIAAAEKRAAAEPTDFGKVRAAAAEASDLLRYEMGGALIRSEHNLSVSKNYQLAFDNRLSIAKVAAVLGPAALIALFVGLTFFKFRSNKYRARFFPSVRITPRLGAPYSGGNNAVSKSF